jgi:hypothetical protein
MIGEE